MRALLLILITTFGGASLACGASRLQSVSPSSVGSGRQVYVHAPAHLARVYGPQQATATAVYRRDGFRTIPPPTPSRPMTPDERLAKLKRLKELKKELLVREARTDFFAFQHCVMKDPEGNYWEPGEIHRRWDGFFADNEFAIQWAPIEHGKTEQRTVAKTLWDIGRDTNTRQVLISETHTQAVKYGGAIRTYIEDDKDYHRVFPHVKPGKQWTEALFTVQRPTISPHPTVLFTGVG